MVLVAATVSKTMAKRTRASKVKENEDPDLVASKKKGRFHPPLSHEKMKTVTNGLKHPEKHILGLAGVQGMAYIQE